jgi:hypothetical protein
MLNGWGIRKRSIILRTESEPYKPGIDYNRLLDTAARTRCSEPGKYLRYRPGELRRPGSKERASTPGYGSWFLADIFQNLSQVTPDQESTSVHSVCNFKLTA